MAEIKVVAVLKRLFEIRNDFGVGISFLFRLFGLFQIDTLDVHGKS